MSRPAPRPDEHRARRIALVASIAAIAAGAGFWMGRRGAPPTAPTSPAAASIAAAASAPAVPSSSAVSPAPRVQPADGACAAELDACRQKSWSVVLEAIAGDARARRDGAARGDAGSDGGDAATRGAGPEEQRRALDRIAREHLRKEWVDKKDDILRSLEDVGTEAWTAKWIADALDKEAPALDLDAAGRRWLEASYRELWARYGPLFQRALGAKPPDARAIFELAKDYYHDEDALIAGRFGPVALARHRALELDGRTVILAILSAVAGEPWDDGIVW